MLGPVPKPTKQWRIFGLVLGINNEYWGQNISGQQQAGKVYNVSVDAQGVQNESDDAAQLAIIESAFQKNYDAYMTCPMTEKNLVPFFEKVMPSGHLLTILGGLDPNLAPKSSSWIGADFYQDGARAANYLIKVLKPGDEVIDVEGLPGSSGGIGRKTGFIETATKGGLNVVATQPADWEQEKSLNVTTDMLKAHPNVKGIFDANGSEALGSIEAVRAAGLTGKVLVTTVDAGQAILDDINNGTLAGTTQPFSDFIGYTAVGLSIRRLEGQKVPSVNYAYQPWMTKDNIADLLKEGTQLMSQ